MVVSEGEIVAPEEKATEYRRYREGLAIWEMHHGGGHGGTDSGVAMKRSMQGRVLKTCACKGVVGELESRKFTWCEEVRHRNSASHTRSQEISSYCLMRVRCRAWLACCGALSKATRDDYIPNGCNYREKILPSSLTGRIASDVPI